MCGGEVWTSGNLSAILGNHFVAQLKIKDVFSQLADLTVFDLNDVYGLVDERHSPSQTPFGNPQGIVIHVRASCSFSCVVSSLIFFQWHYQIKCIHNKVHSSCKARKKTAVHWSFWEIWVGNDVWLVLIKDHDNWNAIVMWLVLEYKSHYEVLRGREEYLAFFVWVLFGSVLEVSMKFMCSTN